jgi:transcriptional regulator with XRE-family HTH domain
MSEVIYNRVAMLRAERGISRRQLAGALNVHSRPWATWSAASTAPACTWC